MARLANAGDVLELNARLFPDKIGARDLDRRMSNLDWFRRSCQLANGLLGIGLTHGDRVCVLAYNCVEWLEIYIAAALAGIVAVPINFRLTAREALYIIGNCEARALIVQDELCGVIEEIRPELAISDGALIAFGAAVPSGWRSYEHLLSEARDSRPGAHVEGSDTWTLMYTSGTTGHPKGALRSHRAGAMLSLITDVELTISRHDTALLVMPMCHANSLYFFGAFHYCGAACAVYNRKSIDPEHLVRTLAESGASFTSLVPTHYSMILDLPAAVRASCNVEAVTKLMISSAPARHETKLAIMDFFRNSGLFELYGSTEAGWVTMLHPDEQLSKLGSVGRECVGSRPIKLLDANGEEVADGEPGELFSCNDYTFDGYWRLPEKTNEAFRGDYCSVGDMARRDEDGFIHLVDRKSNMIISGGENVYPSEVETLLATHDAVRDVAVVGLPDDKWGERVHAVIVLREGAAADPEEIVDWCRSRIAGYKRPRSIAFIRGEEMPRTATGKIQHRLLRMQQEKAAEAGGGDR